MTIFRRVGHNLDYQRNTTSTYSFKRIDYAWRRLVDGTISAELPDRDSDRPWFINVRNGRFTYQSSTDSKYLFVYELPEYLNQNFDPRYPDRQLIYHKETATIVGNNRIKVANAPVVNTPHLHIWLGRNPVRWGDERLLAPALPQNTEFSKLYNVADANLRRGEFTLEPSIPLSADIEVWYHYHPIQYTYQGYKGKNNRFYFLDLNPTAGHTITLESASGDPIDFYTNELLGKTIYLYLLPAYVMEKDETGQWKIVPFSRNRSVLRHTGKPVPESVFGWKDSVAEQIATQEGIPAKDIVKLLAEITLNNSIALNKMELIDTRSRGGGVRKDIKIEELGVEAQYLWDIGFWDGEPYHQNGVVVVRLPQKVLKIHGGQFTEDQVREAVEKHLQLGNLAIIEYLPPETDRVTIPVFENLVPDILDISVGSDKDAAQETLEGRSIFVGSNYPDSTSSPASGQA